MVWNRNTLLKSFENFEHVYVHDTVGGEMSWSNIRVVVWPLAIHQAQYQ